MWIKRLDFEYTIIAKPTPWDRAEQLCSLNNALPMSVGLKREVVAVAVMLGPVALAAWTGGRAYPDGMAWTDGAPWWDGLTVTLPETRGSDCVAATLDRTAAAVFVGRICDDALPVLCKRQRRV